MRLYLSSYRVPVADELLSLYQEDTRTAIITNAKDYKTAEDFELKVSSLESYLGSLSLHTERMDLRTFNSPDAVEASLAGFNAVFVAGGNSFALRYAMRQSGFDQVIGRLVRNGLLYIGESAGAINAGVTLKKAEIVDDESVVPEVIYDGLGLADIIVVPHADSSDAAVLNGAAKMRGFYADDNRLRVLNDNQALIIVDGVERIVSASA